MNKINWYQLLNQLSKATGKPKKYFTRKAGFCGATRLDLSKQNGTRIDLRHQEGVRLLELYGEYCPDLTPPVLETPEQRYCSSCGRKKPYAEVYRVTAVMVKCLSCVEKAYGKH